MDGEAWWPAIHGVAKTRTRLSNFTSTKKKKKSASVPYIKRTWSFLVHMYIRKYTNKTSVNTSDSKESTNLPHSHSVQSGRGGGLKLIRYTWKRKILQKFSLLDRRFLHATGAGKRKCWIQRRGRKSLVIPTQSDSTRNYIFGSSDLSVRGGMQETFQQKWWKGKVVSDCLDPLIMWIMTKKLAFWGRTSVTERRA